MTRDEALELLRGGPEGVKKWNQWRKDNHRVEIPSLKGANLVEAHLEEVNLSRANLQGANLYNAHLEGAQLFGAQLEEGILDEAHLDGADLRLAHLGKAEVAEAHLEGAKLQSAHLEGANLYKSHLERANLHGAYLEGANLCEAHFEGACLFFADLKNAKLFAAHLEGADLRGADFADANVAGVKYDRRTTQFQGIRVETCHGNPLFKRDAQDQDYIEARALKIRSDVQRLSERVTELKNEVERERPGTHDNPSWQCWKKHWILLELTYAEPVKLWPSRIWTVLWRFFDYGRDWVRVAVVAVLLALGFGVIYSLSPGMLEYNDKMVEWWYTPYYYSIVTYTTLGFGDITPITEAGQVLVTIEVVFGYLTLGLLISILANRVARRS